MTLVFVTGGSRGLGFATAKALKELGHQIVLFARDQERLSAAASKLDSEFEVVDMADID
ncbi:MAG: SDR family NAD(P)-dependent oxidoreductase, partial [Candidatus Nanopelagicaceae bacterium]